MQSQLGTALSEERAARTESESRCSCQETRLAASGRELAQLQAVLETERAQLKQCKDELGILEVSRSSCVGIHSFNSNVVSQVYGMFFLKVTMKEMHCFHQAFEDNKLYRYFIVKQGGIKPNVNPSLRYRTQPLQWN